MKTRIISSRFVTLSLATCALLLCSGISPAPKPLPDLSKIYGKIKFVESFPDYKVKIVDSFPDLKVKIVESFPDSPGKWKMVESFPDFKIKIVDSFPDFKIKYVESFPGVAK